MLNGGAIQLWNTPYPPVQDKKDHFGGWQNRFYTGDPKDPSPNVVTLTTMHYEHMIDFNEVKEITILAPVFKTGPLPNDCPDCGLTEGEHRSHYCLKNKWRNAV